MMNEVLKSLHERKSVRAFTDMAISQMDKEAVLLAAAAAPTAGNQQLYTILDITDQELKDKLAISCDDQPFIARAPMVLIFCADFQKWHDAFVEGGCSPRAPGAGDLMLAVQDSAIAAQNAVTAAQSLGIGSCYIGDIMECCELHRELLSLPDYVFPAIMLVFGYPTEQQQKRPKPKRFDLAYIVHENRYQLMTGDKLRIMFQNAAGDLGFDEWINKFCSRKYNSDFSREMNRSVVKYLKEFGREAD